jgi:hypothetical protein
MAVWIQLALGAIFLIWVSTLLSRRLDTAEEKRARQGGSRRPRSFLPKAWSHPGIRVSVGIAVLLLGLDVGIGGSFEFSLIFCPIWFLISVLKNAIQRPGWMLGLARIAVPPLTLALVLANNAVQWRIANANAARVVTACEAFHAATCKFPKTLDELVPRYLPSIPRAKYCLSWGDFMYWNNEGHPILVWCLVPPYGRKIYDFQERRWGYLD